MLTFEEFLINESDAGGLALELAPTQYKRALVHGHCHQKAFDLMPAVTNLLKLVPDLDVEVIPSACCGMAGAFGYDAKTVDVSRQMGEDKLLPAVRAADNDTVIIADGTSCRHQVKDFGDREALHVAQLLLMSIQNESSGSE